MTSRRNFLRVLILHMLFLCFGEAFLDLLDPEALDELLTRLGRKWDDSHAFFGVDRDPVADVEAAMRELYQESLCPPEPFTLWVSKKQHDDFKAAYESLPSWLPTERT